MKNLLKIALLTVVAIVAGACDKEEEKIHTTCPELSPQEFTVDYINTVIQESRALGLAAEEFAAILCEKQWADKVYLQYDPDWTNPGVIHAIIRGEEVVPMAPGAGFHYAFRADGTGFDYSDTVQPDGGDITWSWDPASMVLKIDYADGRGANLHIQGFSQTGFVGYEHRIFTDPTTQEVEQHRIHQYLFVASE